MSVTLHVSWNKGTVRGHRLERAAPLGRNTCQSAGDKDRGMPSPCKHTTLLEQSGPPRTLWPLGRCWGSERTSGGWPW